MLLGLLAALVAACGGGGSDGGGGGGGADGGLDDARADGAVDAPPLTCYDFSLDPDLPLALDGVFGESSPTWQRPHDDEPICPATALLPDTAARVPYVAYAFCNNTNESHTFDFEMIGTDGPMGEPALDDPYLILYEGRNIPPDARDCLAVNDDIPDTINTSDSEILGIEVPAGGAITMVLTTYTFDPTDGTGEGYYIGVVTTAD